MPQSDTQQTRAICRATFLLNTVACLPSSGPTFEESSRATKLLVRKHLCSLANSRCVVEPVQLVIRFRFHEFLLRYVVVIFRLQTYLCTNFQTLEDSYADNHLTSKSVTSKYYSQCHRL